MSKIYVITSGYYNPIHPGHVECFELAKALGDELWVIVNNDHQAFLKRGVKSFQDEQFRMSIVGAIRPVDKVVLCIDQDESVCLSIEKTVSLIREIDDNAVIYFAKGGDRFADNIPEVVVCGKLGVTIKDGLGKKTHSSREYVVLDTENRDGENEK